MSSDFVRCCVCYSDYDLQDHVAVVLSQCGHNVCQICAEKLIESQNECPICRKKFSNDEDALYAPNRQVKEQLERENHYERCPSHVNNLLEFYCHTDKCKICVECHFTKGESGHRGHEVDRIIDLKEELDLKRKIFEASKAKYQAMYDEGKGLLGKRKQEELDSFKSVERITKLVVFETYLGIRTVFDEEESKLEEQYGECSNLKQEIESKINQYSDIKKADLNKVLNEDAEKLAENLDKPELTEYFENLKTLKTMKNPNRPKIIQDESSISLEAAKLSQAKLNTYLNFSVENNALAVTANDVLNKNICIDLDKFEKEVNEINFIFDRFNFNDEDLLLLEYIWIKLQPQVHFVGLEYRNIKVSDSITKFEDHLYAFPRIIFACPQSLKAIDLKFIEAKGSDRYTRLLTEKYLAEANQLTSLKLTYEDTDLSDDILKNFMKSSKILLKDLVQFSLTLKKVDIGHALFSEHYFNLPNLKEFELCNDTSCLSLLFDQHLLVSSLRSMKGLRKCEITLKRNDMTITQFESLFGIFSHMPDLDTLKITIPDFEMSQAKFDELSEFANKMKDPKDLKITVKISDFHNTVRSDAETLDLLRRMAAESESLASHFFSLSQPRPPSNLFSFNTNTNATGPGLFEGLANSRPSEPFNPFIGLTSSTPHGPNSNPGTAGSLFAGLEQSRSSNNNSTGGLFANLASNSTSNTNNNNNNTTGGLFASLEQSGQSESRGLFSFFNAPPNDNL